MNDDEVTARLGNELLIIGSCTCQHPITNHTQLGCSSCPCLTPVGKLATVIRDVETRTEPQ